MRGLATTLKVWWILLVAAATSAVAAGFSPEIHKTATSGSISKFLQYFDDSPIVLNLNDNRLYRSENDGKEWRKVLDGISGIHIDKIKPERAFAFTEGSEHYVSNNRGKSWDTFTADMGPMNNYELINVNHVNPDHIIVGFADCHDGRCDTDIFYTTDGFKSSPKKLPDDISYCTFAKSNGVFDEGPDDRIFCLKTQKDKEGWINRIQLVSSDDFFHSSPKLVDDASNILSTGYVQQLKIIKGFIVAVVQSESINRDGSSVHLFVSTTGSVFTKATIDGVLEVNRFNFLESTRHSIFISAWSTSPTERHRVANIFASDGEGLHFKNLLSNIQYGPMGFLNLEKVETVEGVWTANVFQGHDSTSLRPLVRTKITFDDGHTWSYLKTESCQGDDNCSLNLMSLEERRGDGQGATGATPGLLLGIGNEGDRLDSEVLKLHTYVSRDGGLNWKKTLEQPSIFAFGDLGNIIVASPYSNEDQNLKTSLLLYSLDQAETWNTVELDMESFPFMLTTAIDGTTTKFIYAGLYRDNDNESFNSQVLYSLDFARAFDRNCEDEDFETWSPTRPDGSTCFFGHTDVYKRRKQDAKCFINRVFEDLKIEEKPCACQESDYECNFGFVENSKGECVFDRKIMRKMCVESKQEQIRLLPKVKILDNRCKDKDISHDETVVFECSSLGDSTIEVSENTFHGAVVSYTFLQQSDPSVLVDETVLLKTTDNQVYISHDGGLEFHQFKSQNSEILGYFINPFFPDDIYLINSNNKIQVSHNRASTFEEVNSPSDINGFALNLFTFSNNTGAQVIFYGEEGCESRYADTCMPVAFITLDSGRNWKKLISGVQACEFVGARYEVPGVPENLIFCQVQSLDGQRSLVSSSDFFENSKTLFDNIVGFATTDHFTVVAAIEGDTLKAYVTVDGETFAPAHFPENFRVDKQQAYTILDSETGAIFLHVTTNDREGTEFGAILKSNSNGTSYVLIENYSNRNEFGFVDFERVEGLEGIAIINTVQNPDEAIKGSLKKLQTKLTFNDGSDWEYLVPPSSDSDGRKYECIGKPLSECSLHLHGYTERKDYRDTYSSSSAIGLMIGVGNVGDKLAPMNDGATFLTSNGGLTWKEIKKGVYQWEYGDRGSIIVLVDDQFSTNVIYYSLDEGNSWNEYHFSDEKVKVDDIVTVPSDNSKRFLLITRSGASKGSQSKAFAVDFSNIFVRECHLDLEHPDSDDFEYWTPQHPYSSSGCLFGHEAKYLRKVNGHDCFIGNAPLKDAYKIVRDCPCTRRDFECDFNYVKAPDGTCKLLPGLEPNDASEVCAIDPNAVEYFEPTGYRKVPMSTCKGGQEFDKQNAKPCKGKESEFRDKYGGKVSGFGLALVIVVPILIFVFALWFVYDRGIRRNGGFQRFGEIRLGDDNDLIEETITDVVVNKIVRGGITIIAAVIATYKMVKIIDAALFKSVKNFLTTCRFTTRRGETYTSVDADFRDDEDILNDEETLNDSINNFSIDEDEHAPLHESTADDFLDDISYHSDDNLNYGQYDDDRNLE